MNINSYISCILLNSEKIKKLYSEKKELKNIELINKLCFEVFEKSLSENIFLKQKVEQLSSYIGFNIIDANNLNKFFINYNKVEIIDKIKNTIIIYNIDKYLEISKKFPELDSIFIKKLKLIDYFLKDLPEDDESKFKLKLFIIEKNSVEIDYTLELLKLKKDIYKKGLLKNKNKASEIKMKINSRKIKFINDIENNEKEDNYKELLNFI